MVSKRSLFLAELKRRKLRPAEVVYIVVLILGAVFPIRGQDLTELRVGRTIEGELSAGGRHAFLVDLNANQVVFGEVDQKSLDIVVTVYDPEGGHLARIDDFARGWELIRFESSKPGAHRIELTPAPGESGRYALRLDQVEPLATTLEGGLDQWVRFLDREDRPGGAIAVVQGGEVTYAGAFGLADLTYGIPFTIETASNIGSVSKPFTAFAVALLEKGGKLSFENDLRTYLPELRDFGQPVTLLHLLNHTCGFRELYATLSMQGRIPGRWTREDLIQLVQRQQALQNAPGKSMSYTNTAYILLAEVVERVTGETFPEWMEANVFDPLGMDHTTIKTHSGQIIPSSAKGYSLPADELEWKEGEDLEAFYGAVGIYTTLGDLTNWVRNFSDPRVGGPEVVSQMTERGVLTNGDTLDYGLGLSIDTHRGLRRYSHSGEDGQQFTQFQYYPEIDTGVVYLSNNGFHSSVLGRIAEDLFFAEDPFEEGRAVEEVPEPDLGRVQDLAPVEIEIALLDVYAGHYRADGPGLTAVFSREGNEFFVQVGSWWREPSRLALYPLSDSTFTDETQRQIVTFHRDVDGRVERVTSQGGLAYRRMTPFEPSGEDLVAFAGSYYSPELEVVYALYVEDGKLRLSNPGPQDFEIIPWDPDVFRTVFPLGELRFQRDSDGEVTGFVVTEGVVFERVR